jgi:hypothetical protein
MWMGGSVPLGYVVNDRKLVVHEPDAAVVRSMFERFLRVGSATVLAQELRADGVLTTKGRPIDKGYLYKCLNNRTYLGLAIHKGSAFPGEHAPIIDQAVWDNVHAILAENICTRSARTRAQTPALLKGLLFGPTGAAMSPTHTRKGNRLYRYYVSQDVLQHGRDACPIGRVPAAEIEAAVFDQLRGVFRQPEIVVATWRVARAEQDDVTEEEARHALADLDSLWDELFPAEQARIVQLLVDPSGCPRRRGRRPLPHERPRRACAGNHEEGGMTDDDRTITVRIPLVFKKHGGRKTVILPDGETWEGRPRLVDSALVRALARAFRWQRLLDEGTHGTFVDLAKAEGVSQSHVSRMLRLTLLAPDIVESVLDGRQPAEARLADFLDGFSVEWEVQGKQMGRTSHR